MTRLRTFLTESPYVAAAALTRGGIGWRITREELGLDINIVPNSTVFKERAATINVTDSRRWYHDVDESEWFFLVGGYDILSGSSVLWNAV